MARKNEIEQRCEVIRRYFTTVPKWTFVGLLLSCALTLGEAYALAALAAVVSGLPLWLYLKRRSSDEDYDRIRDQCVDFLLETKALSQWGITRADLLPVDGVVGFPAPALDANTGTRAAKIGKDGRLRYNPVRFTIFGFGEHQMWTYCGILDLMTHNVLSETTEEFFYEHVVGLSTRTESRRYLYDGREHQLNDTEEFTLTSAASTKVSVLIRSVTLASLFRVKELEEPLARKMIAVVRKNLRDKQRARVARSARPDPLIP